MIEEVPRFRQDLAATPVEADGIQYVDVQDPTTGAHFRFYDFEHAIALRMNGQPLADVAIWASDAYGFDSTVEGLKEFAERLAELGFLEGRSASPVPAPNVVGADGAATAIAGEAAPPADEPPDTFDAEATAGGEAFSESPTAGGEAFDKQATVSSATGVAALPDTAAEFVPEVPADALGFDAGPSSPSMTLEADEPPPPDAIELSNEVSSEAVTAVVPIPRRNDEAAAVTMEADEPSGDADERPPSFSLMTAGEPPTELPSDALLELDASPGAQPAAEVPPTRPRGWTGGFNDLSDHNAGPTPPPLPLDAGSPGPTRTLTERRQPPAPDDVVPTPYIEQKPARPANAGGGRSVLKFFVFSVIAAVAAAGIVAKLSKQRGPAPIPVRVVSPTPTSVYAWFSTKGTVRAGGARTLAFESAGKVVEVLPAGATFRAGEAIAKLDGAKRYQTEIGHVRERLAYYQQMLETMTAAGNKAEVRQAEIKIAEKKKTIEEAQAALAKVAVVATEEGQILEPVVVVGASVPAGAPAVKVKGRDPQGVFELTPEEAEQARRLGFCRAEIEGGLPVDCKLGAGDAGRAVVVDLPASEAGSAGKALRLARSRHEAVFPVPLSALVPVAGTDRVFVARPDGHAEVRAVTLADRTATEALVNQGIDVGDAVIVDVPAGLADKSPIQVGGVAHP